LECAIPLGEVSMRPALFAFLVVENVSRATPSGACKRVLILRNGTARYVMAGSLRPSPFGRSSFMNIYTRRGNPDDSHTAATANSSSVDVGAGDESWLIGIRMSLGGQVT
jgi:hypothetical protein